MINITVVYPCESGTSVLKSVVITEVLVPAGVPGNHMVAGLGFLSTDLTILYREHDIIIK